MAFDFPSSPTTGQSYNGYTWDGQKWTLQPTGGLIRRYAYIATAAQTTFTGADLAGNTLGYVVGAVEVVVNGIVLPQADFVATNGTSVVLGLGLAAGDYVYIQAFDSFSFADALQKVLVQVFTANGTYTPSLNMKYAQIECMGGGGGGGGVAGSATFWLCGGGGGGGAYSRRVVSAALVGASQAVAVGAAGVASASGDNTGGLGGDSSVGSLCIAKGGAGGGGASIGHSSPGGAGGLASGGTGDIRGNGPMGTAGFYFNSTTAMLNSAAGCGANTMWGSGGANAGINAATSVGNGQVGAGYGSGGGAAAAATIASNGAGAAGQPGLVVVTEFC